MAIELREIEFRFDPTEVRPDWADGDAFATTFFAALSLLLPEGERFFVESVKQTRDAVTDPALRTRVAAFLGQEAMHGRGHRALDDLLVAHGYDMVPALDRGMKQFMRLVRRTLSPRSQLAVTCALEHITALLAEGLLGDERMQHELDPPIRLLWQWHAFEEIEHKAVAYDVYEAADGGYARRIAMMLLASAMFLIVLPLVQARLMARRRILLRPWRWTRGLARMWLWPAYFTRLVPQYLTYYAPGFHPEQRDTHALLAAWHERLVGARGELRDRMRRSA